MYLRWRQSLPAWVHVVPLELPGRGMRLAEPFVEDYERLVDQLCDELSARRDGRFALFGHSMGALLAHGVTRRLRDRGQAMPCALFASGSPAPARRDPQRFIETRDDAALIADLRQQGGTPEAVFDTPELLRLTLDTLGADYRLCASFRYRRAAPLNMPVHAFTGRDDAITTEQVAAWEHEAGGAFSLDWFEGGHFFIRQQQSRVLATIARLLACPGVEQPRASPAVS